MDAEPRTFSSASLSTHPWGQAVERVLSAAIRSVDPGNAVRRFVQARQGSLYIDGQDCGPEAPGRVRVIAVGKAAHAMATAFQELVTGIHLEGVLIPKHPPPGAVPGLLLQVGGHPLPDENSLAAGARVLELVESLEEKDLLVCLISGGGSALMCAPPAGITLSDLSQLTSQLLASGARIDEINILRRHLDRLKGGGLARLAHPARVVSLILSDVVGNPLEAIASGPTAPDPSTCEDALRVLDKYGLVSRVPKDILEMLRSQQETAKPGDSLFGGVLNVIIGSNHLAAQEAARQAGDEGFHVSLLGNDWQGEASEVGRRLCDTLRERQPDRPFCLIAGGETTVTLHGRGSGGRNQELVLSAVPELARMQDVMLISLATDGEDGPTDAAGAVASQETLSRGAALGLSPGDFLERNDSYHYFGGLQDLLLTGPTGTNVNDLMFLFGF